MLAGCLLFPSTVLGSMERRGGREQQKAKPVPALHPWFASTGTQEASGGSGLQGGQPLCSGLDGLAGP